MRLAHDLIMIIRQLSRTIGELEQELQARTSEADLAKSIVPAVL